MSPVDQTAVTVAWYCPAHGRQESYVDSLPPRCVKRLPIGEACDLELVQAPEHDWQPTLGPLFECQACGATTSRPRGPYEGPCPRGRQGKANAAGKAYPTDPRGAEDAGAREASPKPCCKRITHERAADPALRMRITWCSLPDGHDGQCSGAKPRPLSGGNFLGPAHTSNAKPKETSG